MVISPGGIVALVGSSISKPNITKHLLAQISQLFNLREEFRIISRVLYWHNDKLEWTFKTLRNEILQFRERMTYLDGQNQC